MGRVPLQVPRCAVALCAALLAGAGCKPIQVDFAPDIPDEALVIELKQPEEPVRVEIVPVEPQTGEMVTAESQGLQDPDPPNEGASAGLEPRRQAAEAQNYRRGRMAGAESEPVTEGGPSPTEQGREHTDVELLARIRRAIVRASPSFYAKNVHVGVQDGTVVLRGVVADAAERRKLIDIAAGIAGEKNVSSALRTLK